MKKFLFMFLLVAAVAGVFSFVRAAEDEAMGEKKFILHGEIRQRADFNDNLTDFSGDFDDSFLMFPYRARIGAEGHFSKDVTGYIEFQAFGVWGDAPPIRGDQFGPVGGDNDSFPSFPSGTNIQQNARSGQNFGNDVELYQAYLSFTKIAGSNFSLMLRRQEIVEGTEMLLGDNDFYSGISHDAAVGCWQSKHFDLDVWWSRPLQTPAPATVVPDPVTPVSVPDHQSINFYGAYLDWNRYDSGIGWAAYLLDYEDGLSTGLPDSERRQFWTIGARTDRDVTGKSGFYWNAEYAYQTGDWNNGPGLGDTGSIKASGLEAMIGYNFHGSKDRKVQIIFDQASGDKDSTDQDAKFFDPLFQDSHGRYGLTDIFTFSDLTVWGAGFHSAIGDRTTWGVDYFNQSLTEDIVGGPADGENKLGQEVDGWYKFQYTTNTQITAGLAWFDPGDAIDAVNSAFGASTDSGIRFVTQARLRW